MFDQDVNVAQNDLKIVGVNSPSINVQSFVYEAGEHTATWTIDQVSVDKLLLVLSDTVTAVQSGQALDGEFTTASGQIPTGDGTPGGRFEFRINVLAGDADRNGTNSQNDVQILAANWQLPTTDDNKFVDFDGSNRISGNDGQILATHFQNSLLTLADPTPPPLAPVAAAKKRA